MAYTSTHLTDIENAIIALGKGTRVVQVRSADGDMVSYGLADLPQLQKLRDEIKAEVNAAGSNRRPRVYRAKFSRGY